MAGANEQARGTVIVDRCRDAAHEVVRNHAAGDDGRQGMSKDFVSFDSVRQRVQEVLGSMDLAPLATPVYLVRDLYSRVRVVADEKEVDDATHAALTSMAARLSKVLGTRAHPLSTAVLMLDTDVFKVLDPSIRKFSERVFWIDRLVTHIGWWTVESELQPKRCTLFSVKGGVGVSTAAVIAAWHLARHGERVLLVDLDIQSPGSSSAALEPHSQPEFGVVDWFVEDLVDQGRHVVERMVASPAWAQDLEGSVAIVPAHGMQPGEYLAKLGRIYLRKNTSWTQRLDSMVSELEETWRPTIVLIKSGSGLHDIAAATVTDLGANVLLFATDAVSSWTDYCILFRHWKHNGLAGHMRERLSIVSALTPELGTEEYLARFKEQAWNLFRDHLYDAVDPASTGDEFSFDLHHSFAPHRPVPIHWHSGFAAGTSLHRIERSLVAQAYSEFLQFFDTHLRPVQTR